MSLQISLLALLEAQPMTGYELTKQFDSSVANFWSAGHSQIYPTLRKMEADGLIVGAPVQRGKHAIKRSYSITDAGCVVLTDWANVIVQPANERSETLLKAVYLEWSSHANAQRQFAAHRAYYEKEHARMTAHLHDLRERKTTLMQRRLDGASETAAEAISAYKIHACEAVVARAEIEIQWAKDGLDLVRRLQEKSGLSEDHCPAIPTPRAAPSSVNGGFSLFAEAR